MGARMVRTVPAGPSHTARPEVHGADCSVQTYTVGEVLPPPCPIIVSATSTASLAVPSAVKVKLGNGR